MNGQNQTALIDAAARRALASPRTATLRNRRGCAISAATTWRPAGRPGSSYARRFPTGGRIMLFVGKLDARHAQDHV
jgi:hypothetical protein